MNNHKVNLTEGLRSKDLADHVLSTFSIDRYKSKMGEDKDVAVIGFRIKEKLPAIDLMEFLEKGYKYILDADISSGEEFDGYYHVFVEIERTPKLPKQIKNLLEGIGQLCDCDEWHFKYQKGKNEIPFNEDAIKQNVPLTNEQYDKKILEIKTTDLKEFFNQGAVDISLDENSTIKFNRPYAGTLEAKFISIGDYNNVKDTVPGSLDLSESSQSQVLFLTKFLGNYDINKIGNKFLIKNGDQAIVIEKDKW